MARKKRIAFKEDYDKSSALTMVPCKISEGFGLVGTNFYLPMYQDNGKPISKEQLSVLGIELLNDAMEVPPQVTFHMPTVDGFNICDIIDSFKPLILISNYSSKNRNFYFDIEYWESCAFTPYVVGFTKGGDFVGYLTSSFGGVSDDEPPKVYIEPYFPMTFQLEKIENNIQRAWTGEGEYSYKGMMLPEVREQIRLKEEKMDQIMYDMLPFTVHMYPYDIANPIYVEQPTEAERKSWLSAAKKGKIKPLLTKTFGEKEN